MSLHIYVRYSDIPKGMQTIEVNDSFFNLETKLTETDEVKRLLKKIDGVEYFNEVRVSQIIHGTPVVIRKSELSTGCKTLMNIMMHPDKCFDTVECGDNVLREILQLKEGNVVWRSGYPTYDASCDIVVDGERYTTVPEALQAIHDG